MFKIHVLDDKDFDDLPSTVTRGSDISKSFGFADPFTGNAYVRYTQSHELNKYLINHELEELMEDESAHEDENGIRHKRGLFNMSNKSKQNAERDAALEAEKQAQQQQLAQNQMMQRLMGNSKAGPLGAFSVSGPADQAGAGVGNVASKMGAGSLNQGMNAALNPVGGLSPDIIKMLMAGQQAGRSYYF